MVYSDINKNFGDESNTCKSLDCLILKKVKIFGWTSE